MSATSWLEAASGLLGAIADQADEIERDPVVC